MYHITRRLPTTNIGRYMVLRMARNKLMSLPPAMIVLHPATAARLLAIFPLFKAAMDAIRAMEVTAMQTTVVKNQAARPCRMYVSHFLQTVMMAVEREEIPATALAGYGIDLNSPHLPEMGTTQKLVTAAEITLSGDTARTTAGGIAIPMPTITQVSDRLAALVTALEQQSNVTDQLRVLQDALQDLHQEADAVIRKVWDEVEAFYNEEEPATKRANAREWGVVYVSDTRITISARTVAIAPSGLQFPVAEAVMTLLETDDKDTSDINGVVELKTGYTGMATFRVEAEGFDPVEFTHDLQHATDIDLGNIVLPHTIPVPPAP